MILQAWNTQTTTDLSLSGPVGQVYALVVGNDLLFAGVQVIFSFPFSFEQLYLFLALWLLRSNSKISPDESGVI